MKLQIFRHFDLVLCAYVLLGAFLSFSFNIRFDASYFFDDRVDLQYLTLVLLSLYLFIIYSALSARLRAELYA